MTIKNSPLDKITIKNKTFYIKRDDLLDKDFSGNKARKFCYFLENNFLGIDTVVSYGSNQSNAMYSLSVLAKLKKWNFIYYTYHIPKYLQENPNGNYKAALENGMQLIVDEDFDKTQLNLSSNILFIDEGGAIKEANYGINILANELLEDIKINSIKDPKIFLPSGTGTTALFLQKALKRYNIEVQTTPCVGDSEYLKKQFLELESNQIYHPTIITPFKKFHFGKLYKENFQIWKELKDSTNIEFDLLYDPIGWQVLLNNLDNNTDYIYIHQGGLKGNITMLERYKRKYK